MGKDIDDVKNICSHCSSNKLINYCPNCGQKKFNSIITTKDIVFDALDNIFNISKHFLSTIKALFFKPDRVVYAYISGNRKKYISPFRFLLSVVTLLVGAFLLIQRYLIFNFTINEEKHYVALFFIIFTIFTKVFFYKNTFAMCLITVVYLLCSAIFIFSPILILISLISESQLYLLFYILSVLVYIIISFKKIFKENSYLTVVKVILIFILTNFIYINLLIYI